MTGARQRGFTLTELAVVMVIVGLLLGSGLIVLSSQFERQNHAETAEILRAANEALIGFAISNGRLPCPAVEGSGARGVEAPEGGKDCSEAEGFFPATTLGLSPRDAEGYLLDAWGNRVRYAVSVHIPEIGPDDAECAAGKYGFCPVYTTPQALLGHGVSALEKDRKLNNPADTKENGLLRVCSGECVTSGAGESAIPAVIWSTGPDSTNNAPTSKPGETLTYYYPSTGEHDDLMTWISQYTLFSRMRAASAL